MANEMVYCNANGSVETRYTGSVETRYTEITQQVTAHTIQLIGPRASVRLRAGHLSVIVISRFQ